MRKDISDQELVETIERLNRYADLSDARFRIPGTQIRFGLDSIIGFIPIFGEIVGLLMAFYLIVEAYKLGVPAMIKFKMLRNAIVDVLVGLIPIIGDLADVAFKANLMNMKLLVDHIQEEVERRKLPEQKKNLSVFAIVCISLIVAGSIVALLVWGIPWLSAQP